MEENMFFVNLFIFLIPLSINFELPCRNQKQNLLLIWMIYFKSTFLNQTSNYLIERTCFVMIISTQVQGVKNLRFCLENTFKMNSRTKIVPNLITLTIKLFWNSVKFVRLLNYMAVYLLSYVCLLTDVFEQFRLTLLEEYKLDISYFVSAIHLSLNSLLNYLDWPIHLIIDPEMYRMIQTLILRAICHVSNWYAQANSKLMGSLHYLYKPTLYIMYVDANN